MADCDRTNQKLAADHEEDSANYKEKCDLAPIAPSIGHQNHIPPLSDAETHKPKKPNQYAEDPIIKWTRVLAVFQIVIAVISVGGIAVSYCQMTAMKDQITIMQTDQRPWIGLPKIEPSHDTANPERFIFTLTFKNVGKTPTTGFYIGAQTVDAAAWKSEAFRICDKGRHYAKSNSADFSAFAAIPGDDFHIGDAPGDIATSFTRSYLKEKKIPSPYIVGCVIYGSRFDHDLHQTIFVASLEFIDNKASVQSHYTMYPD